jgi:hypothetical protein
VARPTHLSCARVESCLPQYAPPEPSPEHSFRFSYLSVKLTAGRGLPLESCATAVDFLVCALSRSAPSVSLFGFLLPEASPVSFWEPRQGTADASPRVSTPLASECFSVFVSIDFSRSTRPCRITSFLGLDEFSSDISYRWPVLFLIFQEHRTAGWVSGFSSSGCGEGPPFAARRRPDGLLLS